MKTKLLIILGFLTLNSFAQTVTDSTTTLSEVRIEGVRANKVAPVPQITIKRADIQKFHQGYETSQLLDDTPSVISSSDGGHPYGYTSFRIRGVDQTRINMTFNGVPLNEPEDQGVYFSNYPNFLETVSSLQIQRGVGTSTNGVSSYGGSINFIGETGQTQRTSVKLTNGSFNTTLLNISSGTGLIKDKFSFFYNLTAYESDGYKYGSGGNGFSYYLATSYKVNRNTFRLTFFNGQSRNGMAWLPVSETDINSNPRTNYNDNDSWDNFKQTFAQLEYSRLFNANTKLTTTAFYTKLLGSYDYYMVGKNYFFLDSDFFGLNTNFTKKLTTTEINAGVNGNFYQRQHKSTFEFDSFRNTGFKNEGSSYFKVNQKLGSLNLFADLQYRFVDFSYDGSNYMPNQQWSFFNPKGGFKIKADDNVEVYGFVAQTHREPTRSNLFGGASNFIELSNITSESALDYELGFDVKNSKMTFNMNLYYMDFKNEITSNGEYGDNSLLLFYNVDRSYRSGLEISTLYKFDNGFGINYNSNLSKNGIKGSKLVQLYSPEVIQNLTVSYDRKGFTSSLSAKYHSRSFIDVNNEYTTPEFIIFNANVGYTYRKFSLYLTFINLTNQEYFTNGNAVEGERYFFVNAPLNYSATLKLNF